MTIQEILSQNSISAIIQSIKNNKIDVNVIDLKKQYDVQGHSVMDTAVRPDKQIMKKRKGENGTIVSYVERVEKVGRIGLALQKLITNRAVSFLFGIEPKIKANAVTDIEKALLNTVKKVANVGKVNSLNRAVARDLFRATEVAEIWYPVESENETELYGFKSKIKLKCSLVSPWQGDNLYPLFDDYGDMISFGREYKKINDGKEVLYFEVWTSAFYLKYEQNSGAGAGWTQLENKANTLGKIPVVYANQDEVEWASVATAIERLEWLLSKFADTNDYVGSPILFINGEGISLPDKQEAGKVIKGTGERADAKFVSWEHAPESVKLEIETLFNVVYSFTQTPNISFESVQKIGAISGVALKLLFMDAHLKVMDKKEIFDSYLIRRNNIIKAFLVQMKPEFKAAKDLFIESEIVPYMVTDTKELIDTLATATGGMPVISQKSAVIAAGYVDDVENELLQIENEASKANEINAFGAAN